VRQRQVRRRLHEVRIDQFEAATKRIRAAVLI
jgi:hypothetical protein